MVGIPERTYTVLPFLHRPSRIQSHTGSLSQTMATDAAAVVTDCIAYILVIAAAHRNEDLDILNRMDCCPVGVHVAGWHASGGQVQGKKAINGVTDVAKRRRSDHKQVKRPHQVDEDARVVITDEKLYVERKLVAAKCCSKQQRRSSAVFGHPGLSGRTGRRRRCSRTG